MNKMNVRERARRARSRSRLRARGCGSRGGWRQWGSGRDTRGTSCWFSSPTRWSTSCSSFRSSLNGSGSLCRKCANDQCVLDVQQLQQLEICIMLSRRWVVKKAKLEYKAIAKSPDDIDGRLEVRWRGARRRSNIRDPIRDMIPDIFVEIHARIRSGRSLCSEPLRSISDVRQFLLSEQGRFSVFKSEERADLMSVYWIQFFECQTYSTNIGDILLMKEKMWV